MVENFGKDKPNDDDPKPKVPSEENLWKHKLKKN